MSNEFKVMSLTYGQHGANATLSFTIFSQWDLVWACNKQEVVNVKHEETFLQILRMLRPLSI